MQIETILDVCSEKQTVVRRIRSIMGGPDDSDAKGTKSMSELVGVESITNGGKNKKRKSSGNKK